MKFKLPLMNHKYSMGLETTIKLRIGYYGSDYKNQDFFYVHSGQSLRTPGQRAWSYNVEQMYDKRDIISDALSRFIFLKVPQGTIVKVSKMILSNNMGKHYVSLSITKSHNRKNNWDYPSVYFSLPIEEFEELELESAECKR